MVNMLFNRIYLWFENRSRKKTFMDGIFISFFKMNLLIETIMENRNNSDKIVIDKNDFLEMEQRHSLLKEDIYLIKSMFDQKMFSRRDLVALDNIAIVLDGYGEMINRLGPLMNQVVIEEEFPEFQ